MKLNDIIVLPDGRVGTICWRHLDGEGGIWGRHVFEMPDSGFGDELPPPEFMCREAELDKNTTFRRSHPTAELIGSDFELERTGAEE